MVISVGTVSCLFVWCIYKVLSAPRKPDLHGFEMETPDEKAERDT